jgi:lysyl-tRNA synthetase class 2
MVGTTKKSRVNLDWRPTASIKVLRFRAEIYAKIRTFFANREVLEVETPMLSRYGNTDPNIHSFSTNVGDGADSQKNPWYLHTSPEFPMKRLLSCGSGPIYQICKVFRDGEYGRFHNPEFTLLEWYRPGYNHGITGSAQ